VWHRCKGHRADIWRRPGAKHSSSLCSQSEGANIVADKHELKIHKVMPWSAGHVRYVFVALTLRAK